VPWLQLQPKRFVLKSASEKAAITIHVPTIGINSIRFFGGTVLALKQWRNLLANICKLSGSILKESITNAQCPI
jgi:hypothetical protein